MKNKYIFGKIIFLFFSVFPKIPIMDMSLIVEKILINVTFKGKKLRLASVRSGFAFLSLMECDLGH